ncbi:hypothetical protein MIDIC_140009 [Alphaproteobacteria bacterium]
MEKKYYKTQLNPIIAIEALTQSQSTFTHEDLARFVNTHTVDARQMREGMYRNSKVGG